MGWEADDEEVGRRSDKGEPQASRHRVNMPRFLTHTRAQAHTGRVCVDKRGEGKGRCS